MRKADFVVFFFFWVLLDGAEFVGMDVSLSAMADCLVREGECARAFSVRAICRLTLHVHRAAKFADKARDVDWDSRRWNEA